MRWRPLLRFWKFWPQEILNKKSKKNSKKWKFQISKNLLKICFKIVKNCSKSVKKAYAKRENRLKVVFSTSFFPWIWLKFDSQMRPKWRPNVKSTDLMQIDRFAKQIDRFASDLRAHWSKSIGFASKSTDLLSKSTDLLANRQICSPWRLPNRQICSPWEPSKRTRIDWMSLDTARAAYQRNVLWWDCACVVRRAVVDGIVRLAIQWTPCWASTPKVRHERSAHNP